MSKVETLLEEIDMDVNFINPFLSAALNVIKTMAFMECVPGKPFVKNDRKASGDVTGIIGITGDTEGSLSITFNKSCIESIVSNMIGEEVKGIDDQVRDAVGEITNMISGMARRELEKQGYVLRAAIPSVVSGQGHVIQHISPGPCIAIPFETEKGSFIVEVSFKNNKGA
jgi:chemotaxis protein CheX